jgi:hypothetical protein
MIHPHKANRQINYQILKQSISMKKTVISLLILFSAAFTAFGQSVTITPTTDKQLTLTAAGAALPNITGQRSGGTSAAPTALPSGAWMMSLYGRGYNGSGYSNNYSTAINFGASQDFTPTANGSNIQFYTTSLNTLSTLERMRIDHNGRVGIGTMTPAAPLHVNSPGNYAAEFNGLNQMYIGLFENGVYRGYLGSFAGATEDVDFGTGNTNATGKLHLTIQGTPRLTVAPTGNVGIGTTTPGFPLNFANSVGDKISLWGQSGNHFGLGIDNSLMMIHTDVVGSDIAFGHGTYGAFTERMRIRGDGNVGIGTNTFATGEKFAVSNGTRQFGISPGYFGNIPDVNWTTFNSLALRISGEISVVGKIDTNNSLNVVGFSKLGGDAPAIKVKKLTGTTGAAQGDIIPVPHGLTSTKILSITVLVQFETNGQYVPHSYTNTNGYQFDFFSDATNIQIRNHPTNSGQILSKPIKVMITYEQ